MERSQQIVGVAIVCDQHGEQVPLGQVERRRPLLLLILVCLYWLQSPDIPIVTSPRTVLDIHAYSTCGTGGLNGSCARINPESALGHEALPISRFIPFPSSCKKRGLDISRSKAETAAFFSSCSTMHALRVILSGNDSDSGSQSLVENSPPGPGNWSGTNWSTGLSLASVVIQARRYETHILNRVVWLKTTNRECGLG
jgi:hypothetical protein